MGAQAGATRLDVEGCFLELARYPLTSPGPQEAPVGEVTASSETVGPRRDSRWISGGRLE